MMTKSNRSADLMEWCKWHLACGFDKIIVIDNESTFSVKELLKSYGRVEVRELKGEYGYTNNFNSMYDLYEWICIERKGKTEWLCFIDDDEYLYIKDNKSIKEVLNDKYKVMCIYWKMISLPTMIEDRVESVIDTFNCYAPLRAAWCDNVLFKSIVNLNKSQDIKWIDPHLPIVDGKKKGYTYEGKTAEWICSYFIPDFYDHSNVVLYHYYHQSWKDWEWKCDRAGTNKEGKTFRLKDKEQFIKELADYKEIDNRMKERKELNGRYETIPTGKSQVDAPY